MHISIVFIVSWLFISIGIDWEWVKLSGECSASEEISSLLGIPKIPFLAESGHKLPLKNRGQSIKRSINTHYSNSSIDYWMASMEDK